MKTRLAPHKVRQKEITEWNILILDGGWGGWSGGGVSKPGSQSRWYPETRKTDKFGICHKTFMTVSGDRRASCSLP